MQRLVIIVECKDPSDLDWIRHRCIGAVQDVVDENLDRMDDEVEVSWDIEDGE